MNEYILIWDECLVYLGFKFAPQEKFNFFINHDVPVKFSARIKKQENTTWNSK